MKNVLPKGGIILKTISPQGRELFSEHASQEGLFSEHVSEGRKYFKNMSVKAGELFAEPGFQEGVIIFRTFPPKMELFYEHSLKGGLI